MQRLFRAVCKAQVTVLKGSLRTNRTEISFERDSNGWGEGGEGRAREAKGERGERRENEGRRREGSENERRAKLAKWGGNLLYKGTRAREREFEKTEEAEKTRRGYVLVGLQPAP